MQVMPDGTIHITAPEGFDAARFIAEKNNWISARQAEMNRLAEGHDVAEDQLLLSGTHYTVRENKDRCCIDHRELVITAPDPLTLRRHLIREFRAIATTSVAVRAEEMGVNPGRCAIRMQKSRWGSCSSAGNLNLNLKLYALPTHLMDYVIVHELAHLKILNHSPAFWSKVATHYPAYQKAEADLRRYWVAIERSHWWNALQVQQRE